MSIGILLYLDLEFWEGTLKTLTPSLQENAKYFTTRSYLTLTKERPPLTKPREKTRDELTAEIEDSKKKIRQYENREKMLRQKLSREERRTRNHRLIVRGAVFESIVPEAKDMTDEEAAALLRLALTSEPAQEFLRKRAENGNAG